MTMPVHKRPSSMMTSHQPMRPSPATAVVMPTSALRCALLASLRASDLSALKVIGESRGGFQEGEVELFPGPEVVEARQATWMIGAVGTPGIELPVHGGHGEGPRGARLTGVFGLPGCGKQFRTRRSATF
jgi:hypothetical protein